MPLRFNLFLIQWYQWKSICIGFVFVLSPPCSASENTSYNKETNCVKQLVWFLIEYLLTTVRTLMPKLLQKNNHAIIVIIKVITIPYVNEQIICICCISNLQFKQRRVMLQLFPWLFLNVKSYKISFTKPIVEIIQIQIIMS